MAFDLDTLRSIYRATHGFCHRCRRKLAFSRFGRDEGRGAWDVDAVCPEPKATALVPVCLACAPRLPAPAPAPTTPPACEPPARAANQPALGALLGGACGALLGGLWGALLGGLIGARLDLRG